MFIFLSLFVAFIRWRNQLNLVDHLKTFYTSLRSLFTPKATRLLVSVSDGMGVLAKTEVVLVGSPTQINQAIVVPARVQTQGLDLPMMNGVDEDPEEPLEEPITRS